MPGALPAVRLEYTLTSADLREALTPPTGQHGAARANLFCYAVLLALAVPIAAGWMGEEPPGTLAAAAATPAQDLWVTLAPSLVGFTLVAGGTLLGRWKARRRPPVPAAAASPAIRFNSGDVLLVVAFGWMVLPNVPALAIRWHPTLRRQLWAAVIPWFVYGMYACVIVLTRPRQAAAVLKGQLRSLRRPSVVDVSDDGIVNTDALVDARLRWPYVVSYRETAHLLLLQTEDGSPLILPKRAVPNPADEDVLRRLIQQHVAVGTFLPRDAAFPVLPVPGP